MVDHVFKIHGLPSDIVSDRGSQFTSQFWREFCRQIGASPSLSSGFHPQTNGQAERTNQILGRMLRSLTSRTPASWSDQLSWAEYAHNSLPSSATGLSPFECCLGYQPPLFTSQVSKASVPSVEAFIQRCRRTWKRVRSALCRTRTRTRLAANRHRVRAPRYVCGQKVWLSTRNLPIQESSRKLMPRFIGPFSIVKVLSPVAIKLKLSRQLHRVHPVFHVSCVKPVIRAPPRPPPPIDEVASVYRVHKLLDVRPRGRGHQFLVDWEGYGPEERRWIPARDVLDRSLIEDFYRSRQASSSGAPGGARWGRGTVMSWVCFSVSLSHTQDFTHTHTHTHTHPGTPMLILALIFTCLSSQSALVLLCGDTCSHSDLISYSISNGCACCSLSDYCVSCVCYHFALHVKVPSEV